MIIDPKKCVACGNCVAVCPMGFHLIYLKARPEFDPLHSDPRFADLLRRIRLEK